MKRKLEENEDLQYWEQELKNCKNKKYDSYDQIQDYVEDAKEKLFDFAQKAHDDNDQKTCERFVSILRGIIVKTLVREDISQIFSKSDSNELITNSLNDVVQKAESLDINEDDIEYIKDLIDLNEQNSNKKMYAEISYKPRSPIQYAIRNVEVGGSRGR